MQARGASKENFAKAWKKFPKPARHIEPILLLEMLQYKH